jgi:hypothetical protein
VPPVTVNGSENLTALPLGLPISQPLSAAVNVISPLPATCSAPSGTLTRRQLSE